MIILVDHALSPMCHLRHDSSSELGTGRISVHKPGPNLQVTLTCFLLGHLLGQKSTRSILIVITAWSTLSDGIRKDTL